MARTNNVIVLKATRLADRYEEDLAAGTVKPGHLIKRDSAGKVVVHATAGGGGAMAFAVEDFRGRTIDDVYSTGDVVRYHLAQNGDEILGLLPASATAVVKGSPLTSNGDGCVKLATGSDAVIAHAIDAVDNSAGVAVARCAFRIA